MLNLKQKLSHHQLVLGSWVTLAHPAIPEIMAKAGFDWLAIDLEHSAITIREAEELIRITHLAGCVPLVRLTSNNADLIKRVMDAGAHGIIVPMVNSKAEAEQAVASVYYPPRGKRGVGLARAQGYGVSFAEYKTWLENEAIVIAQIEHIDAVNNVEAILSVPGIDGYIIGPYDLSASLGLAGQLEHPDVRATINKVNTVAKTLGKPSGYHLVEPDKKLLQEKIADGFNFIAYSVDFRMLACACHEGLKGIK